MKKNIVVTGGSGRFGQCLKNFGSNHKILFPTKKELDISGFKAGFGGETRVFLDFNLDCY